MTLAAKEAFKNDLRARGYINFTDSEIDSMYEELSAQQDEANSFFPMADQMVIPDDDNSPIFSPTDYLSQTIQDISSAQAIPDDKFGIDNALGQNLWEMAGGAAWEFANTALFGIPGLIDYDDHLENLARYGEWADREELEAAMKSGEFTPTAAGSIAAGVGGLAGFAMPFGPWAVGTKLIQGATKKFAKEGSERIANNLAGKGSAIDDYLTSIRATKWGKLSENQRKLKFKDITDDIRSIGNVGQPGNPASREAWAKSFQLTSRDTVKEGLSSLQLTTKQLDELMDLVHKGVGTFKGGALPITKLQQKLAIGLSNLVGGAGVRNTTTNKIAEVLGHGIEEGVIFATVDTYLQGMAALEGKVPVEDLPGAAKHAFILGNLFAGIRFLPGGKTQGVVTPALQKIFKESGGRTGTFNYDVTSATDRKSIGLLARKFWDLGGKKFLNAKTDSKFKGYISSVDDINKLVSGKFKDPITNKILSEEQGADLLQKMMNNFRTEWNGTWWKMWLGEMAEDTIKSSHRMLLGGIANVYSIWGDENIRLSDKVFSALVGGFITKKGRVLKYTNATTGERNTVEFTERPFTFNEKFKDLSDLLAFTGNRDVAHNRLLVGLMNQVNIDANFIKASDTKDISLIRKLVKDNNLMVPEGQNVTVKKKNKANENDHPIYNYLYNIFSVLAPSGMRMKRIDEITSTEAKKFEKLLSSSEFTDVMGGKGIEFESDIDDIIIRSNQKAWESIKDVYTKAVVTSYNQLTGSNLTYDPAAKELLVLSNIKFNKTPVGARLQALQEFNNAVNILHEIGAIRKSDNPNRNLLNVDEKLLDVTEKTLMQSNTELNKIWYNGETVLDAGKLVRIGDGLSASFIKSQGFYHGVTKIHKMLWDLDNNAGLWRDPKDGTDHDGLLLRKFINQHFKNADNLLFDTILVEGGRKEDLGRLQQIVDAFKVVLKQHPESASVMVEGTAGTKTIQAKEVIKLSKLLGDNGIVGFNNTNTVDVATFLSSITRYALDRRLKLRSKVVNGKAVPLMGRDRAVIEFMVQSGLVKANNFEMADIVGVVQAVAALPQINKVMGGLRVNPSVAQFTFKGAFKLDMITDPVLKNLVEMGAKHANVAPLDFLKDMMATYKKFVEPYIFDQNTGAGLFKITAKAELDPATLVHTINRLKMIETADLKITHEQLMDTVMKYRDNVDYTADQKAFLSSILGQYFGKSKDTTSLLGVLARFELYDPISNKFDFSHKDVQNRIDQARSAMEFISPKNLSEGIIMQRVNELQSMSKSGKLNDVDVYTSISFDDFLKKYHMTDEWTYNPAMDTPEGILRAIVNKMRVEKDGEIISINDVKDFNILRQGIDDAIGVFKNIAGRRTFQRFEGVQGFGIFAGETKMADNSLFRLMDTVVGNGEYNIVSTTYNLNGIPTNILRNKSAMKMLIADLAGQDIQINKEYKFDNVERGKTAIQAHGEQLLVMFGDMKWAIAVPKRKLNDVASKFIDFIAKTEKDHSGEKDIINRLKKFAEEKIEVKTISEVDASGKTVEKEIRTWKKSTDEADGTYLEAMLNYMYMDKLGPSWYSYLRTNMDGKSPLGIVKLLRRVRMMANVSGVEASPDLLKAVNRLYKDYKIDKDASRAIDELINNDFNGIVLHDEMFDTKDRPLSLLQDAKKQIDIESNSLQGTKLAGKYSFDKIEDSQGRLVFGKTEDSSLTDSWMVVNPSKFKAFSAVYGSGGIDGIGALKPVIAKLGASPLLGKTEMTTHEAFNTFFEKNPNLDYVLVKSGAKFVKGEFDYYQIGEGQGMRDFLATEGIDARTKIKTNEISFTMVKNSDKDATLPYQITNWHDKAVGQSMFDWLLRGELDKWDSRVAESYNPNNPLEALAHAHYLNKSSTNNGSLKSFDLWINNGGYVFSPIFADIYKNQLRSKYLDDSVMSMKSKSGSQAPLVPDLPGKDLRLRNTVFVTDNKTGERTLFTHGQIDIGFNNRYKLVDKNKLNIIEHNTKDFDKIISWNDLASNKEVKNAIIEYFNKSENTKGQKNIANNETLDVTHKLLEYISSKTGRDLAIAVAVHRTPSTRPGDIPVVGLRKILGKEVGNQARLNSWDMKMRIEADFDIDVINFWWNTPKDVLDSWTKSSGKVSKIEVDGEAKKTSIETMDFPTTENPGSIRQYNEKLAHAEFMRGVITKMQRVMQYVKNYDSIKAGEGAELKLGQFEKIALNKDKWDDIAAELARDIQNIVDSNTGYNLQRYADSKQWQKNFLFGNDKLDPAEKYTGLFVKKSYDKNAKGPDKYSVSGKVVDNSVEMEMLFELLTPYRTMLQLGTGVFTNGERSSVRYNDILSYTRDYDHTMGRIGNRVYYKLRNKFKGNDSALKRLDEIFIAKNNQPTIDPFGDFGNSARPMKGKGMDNLLPFERAMAEITYKNRMTLDDYNNRLFGPKLSTFEGVIKEFDLTNDASKAINVLLKETKNDIRTLGFTNYLNYKIRSMTKSMHSLKEKGHFNLAESIESRIGEHKLLLEDAQKQFTTNPEIAKRMLHTVAMGIRTEILRNYSNNSHKRFKTYDQARNWVNNNYKELITIAKAQAKNSPFKFTGINNESHLNNMIWGNILHNFANNLSIDPNHNGGKTMLEMEQHVRTYKKMVRDYNRKVYSGKGKEAWMDKQRVNNRLMEMLERLYSHWQDKGMMEFDGVNDGLGKLLLWKIMAPEQNKTTISYFNGTLMPSYHIGSSQMIKLGLRFIAQSPNHLIPELHKNQLFKIFAQNNNYYHNLFYGRKLTRDFDEIQTLQMIREMNADLYSSPAALIDGDWSEPYTPRTIQEVDVNPNLQKMFGMADDVFGLNYQLSNQPVNPGAMMEVLKNSQRGFMPVGYVPNHYTGMHPRIRGWKSWNEATATDLQIMLGDLAKKNYLHVDVPKVHKNPFTESGTQRETINDLKQINANKAIQNGSIDC